MTPQLRDLVKYAESRQAVLEIFTNARLPQTGELARLIERRRVVIQPIQ